MAAAESSPTGELVLDSSSQQNVEDYATDIDGDRVDSGTSISNSMRDKERKIGHRRVDKSGIVSYKKKPTSELMAAIQLGIGQSVGGLSSKPERDVLMQDFGVVEVVFFPGEGSNLTPAHHYSDFRFKTYAPVAFRYFRDLFGIQPEDFMLSLCNEPLKELSNPGASGSIFYLTHDDEFIIKTVQHKEAEFLQKLLPGYFLNISQNKRTLLPKFYGLYCYQCGGKNIRFTVMNNLLPSIVDLHEKYDMKGSTYKRKASKNERAKKAPTLKDLDFMDIHPECLQLEKDMYDSLIKTLQRDCRVLESFKIMDYSLLVGIYNLDQIKPKEQHSPTANQGSPVFEADAVIDAAYSNASGLHRAKSMRTRIGQFSTPLESIQGGNADLKDDTEEDENAPPGGIPARNAKGERLLLYLGIIDILQSFRLKKRLEHTVKSMVIDGDTISVHRPGYYAQRFLQYHATRVFRKVPTALKHSPSKKRALNKTSKFMQASSDQSEHSTVTTRGSRTISFSDEQTNAEASGGKPPDLLPEYSKAVGKGRQPSNHKGANLNGNSVAQQKRSEAFTMSTYPSEDALSAGTASTASLRAVGGNSSYPHQARGASPPLSLSESTPTHTDFTEGTPSFTNSSPSCSSDMIDMGGLNPLDVMDSPCSSGRSPDLRHRKKMHSGKISGSSTSVARSADDLSQGGFSSELTSPAYHPSPSKRGARTEIMVTVIPESPPPPFESVVSADKEGTPPPEYHKHMQKDQQTNSPQHAPANTTTTTTVNTSTSADIATSVISSSDVSKAVTDGPSAVVGDGHRDVEIVVEKEAISSPPPSTSSPLASLSSSSSSPSATTSTDLTVREILPAEDVADADEMTRL